MSQAKRERLCAMARKYKFYVRCTTRRTNCLALKMAPLASFQCIMKMMPPTQEFCLLELSKLIGPGIKIGWVQAHPSLLKPLSGIGFINSGNNPVILTLAVSHILLSRNLKKHIQFVSKELGRKKRLLCSG